MFKLKYQSSRLFNALTVIILSGLCVLLNSLTRIDFHKLELPKNKPEYSATNFQANLYTPKGILVYQVSAESGTQFPNSNRIMMTDLILQAFNESTTQIAQQLTSKDGWLDNQSLARDYRYRHALLYNGCSRSSEFDDGAGYASAISDGYIPG